MLVCRVAQGRELVHQPSYDDSQLDRVVDDGLRRLENNLYSNPSSVTYTQTTLAGIVTARPVAGKQCPNHYSDSYLIQLQFLFF